MDVSWSTFCIKEVAILSGIIYPVQFSLPHIKVRLPQRPCLGHGELFKVISYLQELVVCFLETFIDFPFPTSISYVS